MDYLELLELQREDSRQRALLHRPVSVLLSSHRSVHVDDINDERGAESSILQTAVPS